MANSISVLYLGDRSLIAPFLHSISAEGIKLNTAPLDRMAFQEPEPTISHDATPLRSELDSNCWAVKPIDYQIILIAADQATYYRHLSSIKLCHPSAQLIWLGDANSMDAAERIMKDGVYDYLLFPFSGTQLIKVIRSAIKSTASNQAVIAEAQNSRQVLKDATTAALTNTSILLHGETGTGKEVLARYIHSVSDRSEKPFIALNCAALPESMLESILFGHKKGSFTGATSDHIGKFEAANGGTIFLDEITEMPINLQAKLLRVLQEKTLEKLGCNKVVNLDIRIISATNRPFENLRLSSCLRSDVFYRLSVISISWPALKDRKKDIIPLAEYFLRKHGGKQGYQLKADAVTDLYTYDWPGNVRELENRIERGLAFAKSIHLTSNDLGFEKKSDFFSDLENGRDIEPASKISYRESQRLLEFKNIKLLLDELQGDRKEVAARLNISTRGLRYKLQQMRERNFI